MMGLMVVLLTVCGLTGRRLSGCSWSCRRRDVPPTQMSAPESDKARAAACPLREDTWTLIIGAGSMVGRRWEASRGVAEMACVPAGVEGCCGCVDCGRGHRHTLAKWPTFLHIRHVSL